MASARRVVIAVFPDVQTLDAVGPLEVFNGASRMVPGAYAIEVAGPNRRALRTSSGLTITPDRSFGEVRGGIDTLVVAGGAGTLKIADDPSFVVWLRRVAKCSRRVTSVCTGSFLLAKAGLLDGRRATPHWASCEKLAERYPEIGGDAHPIFVRGGAPWTPGGGPPGVGPCL